ncbi:MAG: putative metalloenzyme radical SAM/SPASM domain maturase [Desulforhopalus sp.]|jgi:putative metalloenzyme radical SAM/SPASM domain maturase
MKNFVMASPKKVYVELTTRCNLQCQMCVKYTKGSCIPEEDMSVEMFRKILPSLGDIDTLILNGIGESLLHSDLVAIVQLARTSMAPKATIGLQSNGLLLDRTLAHDLICAGLNTICLSVDRFEDPKLDTKGEHSFRAVQRAVDNLLLAKKEQVSDFTIGFEIVLTRQTIPDLPTLVGWAADNGIAYILSSHLILYDTAAETECIFNPHPPEALELFSRYCKIASAKGLDFNQELLHYRRHAGTQSTELFTALLSELLAEAKGRDIQLNFVDLNLDDLQRSQELEKAITATKELATNRGLELFIPSLQATSTRECRFLKEKAVFISANGDVAPCHFLWHTYSCRILKNEAKVKKRSFGNVSHKTLDEIWQSRNYSSFRQEAGSYEYTYCWTCAQGPCPTLLTDDGNYANDCYGSQVPCGHCQWNLGGIRCL